MHISNQILELTKAIHAMSAGQSDGSANQAGNEVDPASYDRRAKQVAKQGEEADSEQREWAQA